MLTCISRLMPITGGSMTFCGADISRMRPEEVVNLGLIQCPCLLYTSGSSYQQLAYFVLFILVILLKPEGILARRKKGV